MKILHSPRLPHYCLSTLFGTTLGLTLKTLGFRILFVDLQGRCSVSAGLLTVAAFKIDLAEVHVGVDQPIVPENGGFEGACRLFAIGAAEMNLAENEIAFC